MHLLLYTCPRLHNRSPPCPTYKSVMLVTGDRGCGKTSVLANWVQEFSSREDLKVFAHYVGSSALSFDIMCFMRRCTVEMRDKGPQLQRESRPDTSLVGCMCMYHLLAVCVCITCWLYVYVSLVGCMCMYHLLAVCVCITCWLYVYVSLVGCMCMYVQLLFTEGNTEEEMITSVYKHLGDLC